MSFIRIVRHKNIIYYNLDELKFLNLLPLWTDELEYGEIFFKDGKSFAIIFDCEKHQEFIDLIMCRTTFISLQCVDMEEEIEKDIELEKQLSSEVEK